MHLFEYNTALMTYLVVFIGVATIVTVGSLGVVASVVISSLRHRVRHVVVPSRPANARSAHASI